MHIEFSPSWWEFEHTKTHYLHKLFSLVWNALPCFSIMFSPLVYPLPNSDKIRLCFALLFDLILITVSS